ncbi:hypothetical protein V6N11_008973 [Hibiscus sabdariffa]|uniref:Uncharacterized protein n=2 Tax=Hibiscus sabdariffa TaxID=183260 RepID=A0ABR1ZY28_9ROSI
MSCQATRFLLAFLENRPNVKPFFTIAHLHSIPKIFFITLVIKPSERIRPPVQIFYSQENRIAHAEQYLAMLLKLQRKQGSDPAYYKKVSHAY